MTNNKLHRTAQPDGQHHNTHPVYHFQHLISTTPLNTTRPEPYRTLQQLTRAELITTARKTIAQLARTQHPYPNHIPNRYYRHFQRYFDPDAAFQHLFRHTLHAVPTDHCSAYARGSAWGGWTGGARWGECRGRVQWAFGCQRACGVCSRLLEMADYPLDKRIERVASNYTNSVAHHSRAQ
jgi:hypothetical protein